MSLEINPVSKSKLMKLLVKLNKVDQELYELLMPDHRYPSQTEGWYLLGYQNILNAVYYEFCGESEKVVYQQFKTSNHHGADIPTAWYKAKFSSKDDGSIKGPKGYGRFIPDCINDVILTHKLKAGEKLKLLTRMFEDLKKLKEQYGKEK